MRRWTCWIALCFLLSVFALGCGGGGGGGSAGVTVTIAPKAVTLILNGTQQFAASVSGGSLSVATIVSGNGAARSANVVTITTTGAHGLSVGQIVTISGVSDSSFNGAFTIATVPSTTTFTYAQTGADATSGGGTVSTSAVKWFVNDKEGGDLATTGSISTTGLYTAPANLPPASTLTIASSGAVRSNNVVTVTTTAAHNLVVGQVVTISGVTDASFNGTFLVQTVPSSTTFTYAQTAANATSGGGTVTTTAVQVKAQAVADSTKSDTAAVSLVSGITLSVSPRTATVGTSETLQFRPTVSGTSNTNVTWSIDPTTSGSISSNGLYTAPDSVPNPTTVPIASGNGAARSANVVTITTTSAHGFSAGQTVTISGVTDSSFNGTFTVATVPSTTTFTYAQTGPNATSGSGTVSTGTATVTVKATSAADPSKTATATVTVVAAADPTLTAISPASAAQGSLFQDVYLTGTNFISTTTVLVNGTTLPSSAITAVNNTLLRAQLPDCFLSAIPSGGNLTIAARRQNGTTTSTKNLTVVPVRPALVAASPDSATQTPSVSDASVPFNVNGGYFGTSGPCAPSTSVAVTVEFDGSRRDAPSVTSRQLNVIIGGPGNPDLHTAGLFSVAVRNSAAAQPVAVTNFAVQPAPAVNPPSMVTTLTVGTKPGAVAVNAAAGIAVVANHDSNNITIIDLKTSPPSIPGTVGGNPNPIPVGTGPTGVAAANVPDAAGNVRNLAVVANNLGNSVWVVNLGTGIVTDRLGSADNIGNAPLSVGINALTGLALVAYQSTNNVSVIDLNASGGPKVVTAVTASTGANPQVAIEPRLNWAVVTPGGGGSLSIVDLSRRNRNDIAAAPNGAVRSNNTVTVTTTAAHSLVVNQAVLISGVTDPSFNGVFTVASIPSSTTFTYAQTAPPANSGGGTVTYALPLATATLGIGVRGIGINPETEKALLVDPTSSSVLFFSVLDQTVNTLTLETGAVAAAVNPLTDIGVTINPRDGTGPGTVSLIDPRTPALLATRDVGTNPKAVAIDPTTNLALVANEGSNTVTVLSLGIIRPLHITEIRPFLTTSTSASPVTVTVTGNGFVTTSTVRLDGVSLSPANVVFVSDRQLNVTVPAAMLGAPRRYALDVVNPNGVHSNVADFAVIRAVDLKSTGCDSPQPRAVAIDPELNLAVVTRPNCNDIALVDLATGTVRPPIAVGTNPQGVAVIPRLGKAVVTNRGSSNASIVDLAGGTVSSTVTVGTEPIGVAINQDTATAVVANSASNTLSTFSADTGGAASSIAVDARPVAVAIDPGRNLAVVAQAAQNNAALVDLASATVTNRVGGFQLPTAVIFDPISGFFLVNSSLTNTFSIVNPDTLQVTPVRVGINPTAMAYNFQSSTLVTANAASGTVSVMDFIGRGVRAVLGSSVAPQCLNPIVVGSVQQQPPCSVDIHPRTNLGAFVDGDNNRLLLIPLPR